MIRVYRNGWKHTIGVMISVKNGSLFETKETEGFTHAAEHFMFSGTRKHTRFDLREMHDDIFNGLEATTSVNEVNIVCYVDQADLKTAVGVLHEMIFDWKCRKDVFNDEKNDLLNEIRAYSASPEYRFRHERNALLSFGQHEILGKQSRISKLKFNDLNEIKKYWSALLKQSQIDILLVGGNVDPREIKNIKDLFGARIQNQPKSVSWQCVDVVWFERPNINVLQICSNGHHPYLLLLDRIFYRRWTTHPKNIDVYEFALLPGRTLFSLFCERGMKTAGGSSLFCNPITKDEFEREKSQFLKSFRSRLDGVDAIDTLRWIQGFNHRTYADLPSIDPRVIYRMFEKLAYKSFQAFADSIFRAIR